MVIILRLDQGNINTPVQFELFTIVFQRAPVSFGYDFLKIYIWALNALRSCIEILNISKGM